MPKRQPKRQQKLRRKLPRLPSSRPPKKPRPLPVPKPLLHAKRKLRRIPLPNNPRRRGRRLLQRLLPSALLKLRPRRPQLPRLPLQRRPLQRKPPPPERQPPTKLRLLGRPQLTRPLLRRQQKPRQRRLLLLRQPPSVLLRPRPKRLPPRKLPLRRNLLLRNPLMPRRLLLLRLLMINLPNRHYFHLQDLTLKAQKNSLPISSGLTLEFLKEQNQRIMPITTASALLRNGSFCGFSTLECRLVRQHKLLLKREKWSNELCWRRKMATTMMMSLTACSWKRKRKTIKVQESVTCQWTKLLSPLILREKFLKDFPERALSFPTGMMQERTSIFPHQKSGSITVRAQPVKSPVTLPPYHWFHQLCKPNHHLEAVEDERILRLKCIMIIKAKTKRERKKWKWKQEPTTIMIKEEITTS
mmetsp:Transcript_22022/g.45616  ORF Transcript_22022/g.45616 Transcript_22022/m.45616 type:complete len:414 (-) Transcript_22022:1726-2967(-)